MKKRSRSAPDSSFCGFKIKKGDAVDVVRSPTGEQFFANYVAARKPCVITDFVLENVDVSVDSLLRVAADETVEVELPPFGSGKKCEMRFGDFCGNPSAGYMTTQRNQTSVVSVPLSKISDFPLFLPFSGKLRTANVNMWMSGATRSSTPLHVDFHDNFYLLVHGKKIFRIFSPDCAVDMCTNGRVAKVHKNGLINFEGHSTNSDGSTEYALAMKVLENDDDEDAAEKAMEVVLDYEAAAHDEDVDKEPDHFCTISSAEAAKKHPCITVELSAGQMLFLPAGFFHQVDSVVEDGCKYHQAVNWWFHPADTQDFANPYSTTCWN